MQAGKGQDDVESAHSLTNWPRRHTASPGDVISLAWYYVIRASIPLLLLAVILNVSPHVARVSIETERSIVQAQGHLASSTCLYFARQLKPDEEERWKRQALDAGEQNCINSKILLSQSPLFMKMRRFVMDILPWSPDNLPSLLQYGALAISCFGSFFFRAAVF
jgi:hypothetical protein